MSTGHMIAAVAGCAHCDGGGARGDTNVHAGKNAHYREPNIVEQEKRRL